MIGFATIIDIPGKGVFTAKGKWHGTWKGERERNSPSSSAVSLNFFLFCTCDFSVTLFCFSLRTSITDLVCFYLFQVCNTLSTWFSTVRKALCLPVHSYRFVIVPKWPFFPILPKEFPGPVPHGCIWILNVKSWQFCRIQSVILPLPTPTPPPPFVNGIVWQFVLLSPQQQQFIGCLFQVVKIDSLFVRLGLWKVTAGPAESWWKSIVHTAVTSAPVMKGLHFFKDKVGVE